MIDRSMMEIVLMNIVGNALKYTKVGGVHLALIRKQADVQILVKDTGLGIAEKDSERIFEPFFQSIESSESTIEGSGLGLSISKHYVEQMHGRIWLTSELGVGSTFTISIKAIDQSR
ncbi:MAG: ATP-binding protein [Flavobacteriales bacterium]|nr:ATP-binding protein [Flavobacteriales bacterium]